MVLILALSGLLFADSDIVQKKESATDKFVFFNRNIFYVGTGYSYILSNRTATHNEPSDPNHGSVVRDRDTNANGMLLKAGYQFNRYLAIEGRYTFSIGDHTITDNLSSGSSEKVDVDLYNLALYLKPIYNIGDFSVYGLLGYGKVTRKQNTTPSHKWDSSNFQWGLGVQYTIVTNYSIFLDFIQWHDSNNEPHERIPRLLDTDFSDISVGLAYTF